LIYQRCFSGSRGPDRRRLGPHQAVVLCSYINPLYRIGGGVPVRC
jgi:hypothetical protein